MSDSYTDLNQNMDREKQKMFEAAKQGDLTFFKSRNFDENIVDEDGANCLHYVCRGGNVQLAQYFVDEKQFDVSKKTKFGSTAFHEAAASGSLDIVKWLWTKTEINIDEQDGMGATPLHIGALYGQLLVVHWIINNTSCDLMLKTDKGALCLHFAVVGGSLKVTKIILAEIPRSINLQLKNGTTPAYLASQFGYLDVLKYLVEKGANLNMKSFDGMSCLHAACQGGHLDVVKWLVKEQKCNVNDRDLDGASCLHFAATNGRARVVEWMVKEGGAKVTLDNLGGSPLHNAVELGHFEVVKALIDNGCNVDIIDNEGLTAAELAEKCNHLSCAALIRGEFENKDHYSDNFTPVVSINNNVVNSNGNLTQSDLDFNLHSNKSDTQISTNVFDTPTPFSSNSNTLNCFNNNNLILDTFDTCHHQIPHNSTEQESTEYLLPERDYPEDDEDEDLLSSPENQIIYSSPTDDYKKHQINPDIYQPPDLPPDTSSENNSEASEIINSVAEPNSCRQSSETGECELADGIHSPLQESDLSSATSTLSSTSRRNSILRSNQSDNSVHFESKLHSPTHSGQDVPLTSPRHIGRIAPSPSLLGPGSYTNIKSTRVQFDKTSNFEEKNTVPQSKDNFRNKEIPNPPPFPDLGILGKQPTLKPVTSSIPSYKHSTRNYFIGRTNMSDSVNVKKTDLLSELKQMQLSNSDTNLNENGGSDDENSVHMRSNGDTNHQDMDRPVSMTNGGVNNSLRPNRLSTSSSAGNLSPMSNNSPTIGRNFDLVDELKKKDLSELRVTKKPGEGKQVKMVFSFGDPSPAITPKSEQKENNVSQKESRSKSPALTGEFDPKNFLDKVPDTDNTGIPYPDWKKQLIARQLAEKALKDAEEEKKKEEYEARFRNMPAWKRQMIERKEAQKLQGNK